jgi:hypothetical protein
MGLGGFPPTSLRHFEHILQNFLRLVFAHRAARTDKGFVQIDQYVEKPMLPPLHQLADLIDALIMAFDRFQK